MFINALNYSMGIIVYDVKIKLCSLGIADTRQ